MNNAVANKQFKTYSLSNDAMFKIVFAVTGNEKLLIYLLNALLQYKGDDVIEEVTLLNPFVPLKLPSDKAPILDILATDRLGRKFCIEVQRQTHSALMKRILYYGSVNFTSQIKEGEDYTALKKTICLWIFNEKFTANTDIYSKHLIKNDKTNEVTTDLIEYHFVELSKYHKKDHEKKTRFEKWLHILKFSDTYKTIDDLPLELAEEPGIKEVLQNMQQANINPALREVMHSYEMAELDRRTDLRLAREEGIEIGETRGIEIGETRGIEKKAIEMARRMLKDALPVETIINYTGLTKNDIQKLSNLEQN